VDAAGGMLVAAAFVIVEGFGRRLDLSALQQRFVAYGYEDHHDDRSVILRLRREIAPDASTGSTSI
jgi:hypothetical protein